MLPITASGCTAEDANLACLVRAPDIAGHAGEDVRLIRHMTFLLVFARPDPSSQRGSAHPTFAPVAAPSAHASAAIELGHDEFAMAQRFGGRQPSIGGADHHVDQRVAGAIERQLAAQDTGHVDVDVLGHGAHCARVARDLNDGDDWIANDVALAGREGMHDIARRRHQRHALGRRRGSIHVIEARAGCRRLGRLEYLDVAAAAADLLEVAERLLLDGGEPAGDVALGRLAVHEIVDPVGLDDLVLVGLEHLHPLFADVCIDGARFGDVLRPGDLGGLPEDPGDALGDELIVHVAHRGTGGEAGGGVALAALGRHPQIADRALLTLKLGSPVQELLGLVGGLGHGGDITVALDAEADHGLAGFGNAVDHALGPAVLDADDDDGSHVRVGPGADQGPEEKVEVGAELQPAIGVRQRQCTLDVVGYRLAGGIGKIIERQDDHVVAHAHATVLASPAAKAQVASGTAAFAVGFGGHDLGPHQRLVLRFCTCTCSPAAASAVMRPMSSPYLMTVSPFFRGLSATLWPIGISLLAWSVSVLSVAVMTPSISVPARSPSTTTTPTLSFGLWTRKCGVATRFPLLSGFVPPCSADWSCGVHSYIRHV